MAFLPSFILRVLLLGVAISLFITQFLKRKEKLPKGSRLPPGPSGVPVVGNLLDIPRKHSWVKFKVWADQYGPLMRLNLGGRDHYVVSKESIANDLLRERGNFYSSREQTPAAAQLLSGGLRPLLLPYNDVWRNGRRLMHHLLMTDAAKSYQPTQVLESTRLLRDLIRSPKDYEHYLERYASGLIFRLAFGKVLNNSTKSLADRVFSVNHTLERVASPGAYLVDTFPIMMRIPRWLAPWRRELEHYHEQELGLFKELLNDTRRDMQAGKSRPCWERRFIEERQKYQLSDDQGAYVIGTLFEAGSGTTSAAMMSFLLAMVHYPQWQSKIQDEIERVVGKNRLPDFGDIPSLPSVRAAAKETLRWRPVTAGGIPHLCTKHDVYQGYLIPAGTIIHPNQWAIHRDTDLYPDPETFNPGRWLDESYPTYKGPLSKYPNLQNYSAFGFGRRICPGQNIAERSLYIQIAMILWGCKISKAKRPDGSEIDPPLYDYTTGFNAQPKWFPFDLRVQTEAKQQLIELAYQRAQRKDPFGVW